RVVAPDVEPGWGTLAFTHPADRRAIFLGDLVDRGPRNIDVLSIVRHMVKSGSALCVPGNHDVKLLKKLKGREVTINHGLAETLAEIDALPEEMRDNFRASAAQFIDGLVSHYILDDGRLVVAHAGMKEEMQGRGSGRVRDFALYGETTGEIDEFGLPVRHNWAAEYRGAANVVYGHTPVPEAEWLNRTVDIDTGCVFGGKLTALRYPEKELVSVPARRTYCEPARPFLLENCAQPENKSTGGLSAQHEVDDLLDVADVLGKRIISTRWASNVTIREENAAAALEVMSRFAANPKWLIYLPPTMSPCGTSSLPGLLEHPAEAFAYFREEGIAQVVCEEKHMGSRAVVIICRDARAARERFGIVEDEAGIVYTRTGRRFFTDSALEVAFLDRVRDAMTASGFWEKFHTSWACFDCELMPWSAKAQELLRAQYAAVGAAGQTSLAAGVNVLQQATMRLRGTEAEAATGLLDRVQSLHENVDRFVSAYRNYCWKVESLDDLRLSPFHLLATEGQMHTHQNHVWQMETIADICRIDPLFLLQTPYRLVDVNDPDSEAAGTGWWEELTGRGGEGMVVKPLDFVTQGSKKLAQPAVKCRGREYLRIIYGPDYTAERNLNRLRKRGLGAKRSLALREFALGLEGLERFVRRESLRQVHECVFGVLALESEPVDPRL
ncbi:MAG: polynucleotide kinase-phosphatase, partial [Planctomyces sp.]|nr:polynucleotide kinase-phosphatase [Planctomyces sp.]